MSDEVVYGYGVVPLALLSQLAAAPGGIDDALVSAVAGDRLAVLVSRVDAATYDPAAVEVAAAAMSWMGPRAAAHDRVVTWASDLGTVVPLPVLSLFHDEHSVHRLLTDRDAELRATVERVSGAREYGVRMVQDESRMAGALSRLRPRIAALEAEVAAASPGQAYLLRRKLDGARREELQALTAEVATSTWERLQGASRESLVLPLPALAANAERLVLDAVFLVENARLDAFREALTAIMGEQDDAGFRFAFTGPWPPYHFVRVDAAGSAPGAP